MPIFVICPLLWLLNIIYNFIAKVMKFYLSVSATKIIVKPVNARVRSEYSVEANISKYEAHIYSL
jgi:hypothetical protein